MSAATRKDSKDAMLLMQQRFPQYFQKKTSGPNSAVKPAPAPPTDLAPGSSARSSTSSTTSSTTAAPPRKVGVAEDEVTSATSPRPSRDNSDASSTSSGSSLKPQPPAGPPPLQNSPHATPSMPAQKLGAANGGNSGPNTPRAGRAHTATVLSPELPDGRRTPTPTATTPTPTATTPSSRAPHLPALKEVVEECQERAATAPHPSSINASTSSSISSFRAFQDTPAFPSTTPSPRDNHHPNSSSVDPDSSEEEEDAAMPTIGDSKKSGARANSALPPSTSALLMSMRRKTPFDLGVNKELLKGLNKQRSASPSSSDSDTDQDIPSAPMAEPYVASVGALNVKHRERNSTVTFHDTFPKRHSDAKTPIRADSPGCFTARETTPVFLPRVHYGKQRILRF